MTMMQLNAEIHRNLNYLSDSESYLQKVLDFLKKLSKQKVKDDVANGSTKKIHVDDGPLPTDKYLGMFSPSSREDDRRMKEEYMKDKYGAYL